MAFGSQSLAMNSDLSVCRTPRRPGRGGRHMARIIGVAWVVFLTGGSAFAQFIVDPMQVRVAVTAGKEVWQKVSINNTQNEAQVVDLSIVDLTQGPDGVWQRIEVDDPNADVASSRSCRSWLWLPEETVNLPPTQIAPAQVRIRVPRGAAGYYFAAIIASMQPRPGEVEGWTAGMGLEFLIPVIVQVHGRFLRCNVSLEDVGLSFQRQTEDTLPASLAHLTIRNAGLTYSRLEAVVRVSKKMGGHWRRITEVKVPNDGDLGIIPDVTLNLGQDVGRPLPAGQYQVQAFLKVDGRRADQLEREITFAGDPRAPLNLSTDAALDLDPVEVVLQAVPGQMRIARMQVFNASEEAVEVDMAASLPEHMIAMALPPYSDGRIVRGEQFDCSSWLTFQPAQFTMQGYGRQYVQIKCDLPETATAIPEYFALLKFRARFPGGQEAGTTKGRLYVENTKVQASPRVEVLRVTFNAQATASRYFVAAECVNIGDTRVMPRCRAVVRAVPDQTEQQRFEMNSDIIYQAYGPMLPIEKRMFSGVLDVSVLEPGPYLLTVVLDHDRAGVAQDAQRAKAFRVIEDGGVKTIEELDLGAVGGAIPVRL